MRSMEAIIITITLVVVRRGIIRCWRSSLINVIIRLWRTPLGNGGRVQQQQLGTHWKGSNGKILFCAST